MAAQQPPPPPESNPQPGPQPPPPSGYGTPGATPPPPPAQYQPGGYPVPAAAGNLAGWWRRFGAILIDSILVGIVSYIISAIVHLNQGGLISGSTLIGDVLSLVYFVYFWSMQNGRTLGNMALGIQVQKIDGGQLDLGSAALRWLLLPSPIPFLGIISGLVAAFDERRQGLHDKVANTIVVRTS